MTSPAFVFSPEVLLRAEKYRAPGVVRHVPGETPEQYAERRREEWNHQCCLRDEILIELHEQFAASRGLILSDKLVPMSAVVFGCRQEQYWGELTREMLLIEQHTIKVVAMRSRGGGAKLPHQIWHTTAPRAVVDRAVSTMRLWGAKPSVLPFSFCNPRAAHALYVSPAPGPRGMHE